LRIIENKLLIQNFTNNKVDTAEVISAESFVRYAYRDSVSSYIDSDDESSNILNVVSYIWLFIIRNFNIVFMNRYSNLFKEGNENVIVMYKNLFFSSRNQFARIFTVERREETKGQLKVIINSWLILKSRNKVMQPINIRTSKLQGSLNLDFYWKFYL
jgi:hypothetical protein